MTTQIGSQTMTTEKIETLDAGSEQAPNTMEVSGYSTQAYQTNQKYRELSVAIRELQLENAELKEENARLKEQLRVKGVGVPFNVTSSQLFAFFDSDDSDSDNFTSNS